MYQYYFYFILIQEIILKVPIFNSNLKTIVNIFKNFLLEPHKKDYDIV